MHARILIIAGVLLAATPLGVPSASAKVPSFALWSAREGNYTGALIAHAKTGKDVLAALPKAKAHWERGITAISKPQTTSCKRAIHTYWAKTIKYFNAEVIYVRAHEGASVASIGAVLSSSEPYSTLVDVKEAAKSHAVRVCG